jgi:hypothetical protein
MSSIVSIVQGDFGELPEINVNPRKLNISGLVLGTLDSPYHRVAYYIQEYDIRLAPCLCGRRGNFSWVFPAKRNPKAEKLEEPAFRVSGWAQYILECLLKDGEVAQGLDVSDIKQLGIPVKTVLDTAEIQYAHTYRVKAVHPMFIQRCEGCNTAVLRGMHGVRH